MTPGVPLTPAGALGWLRSMSVDIREAAVLDAAGALLAGDAALASAAGASSPAAGAAPSPASGAVASPAAGAVASPAAGAVASPAAGGGVLVARSPTHVIVVRRGPCALERLLRADLQAALDALAGR